MCTHVRTILIATAKLVSGLAAPAAPADGCRTQNRQEITGSPLGPPVIRSQGHRLGKVWAKCRRRQGAGKAPTVVLVQCHRRLRMMIRNALLAVPGEDEVSSRMRSGAT